MPKPNATTFKADAEVEVRSPSAPPPPPKPAPKMKGAVALPTVDEHARRLGHIVKIKNPHPGREEFDCAHACAATLHGWRQHQHHEGVPMRLSEGDYKAALAAAERPPPGKRHLEPHGPALSKHHPHKDAAGNDRFTRSK